MSKETDVDIASNEMCGEAAAPYPDWYLELKRARPWLVMHREDGPPRPLAKAPEIAMEDEDIYFQPRWAD